MRTRASSRTSPSPAHSRRALPYRVAASAHQERRREEHRGERAAHAGLLSVPLRGREHLPVRELERRDQRESSLRWERLLPLHGSGEFVERHGRGHLARVVPAHPIRHGEEAKSRNADEAVLVVRATADERPARVGGQPRESLAARHRGRSRARRRHVAPTFRAAKLRERTSRSPRASSSRTMRPIACRRSGVMCAKLARKRRRGGARPWRSRLDPLLERTPGCVHEQPERLPPPHGVAQSARHGGGLKLRRDAPNHTGPRGRSEAIGNRQSIRQSDEHSRT